jgi:hypothetical protein
MNETQDGNGKQTSDDPGCIATCVTVLLVIVGVFWLVTGSIDISSKDIHLQGLHARSLALMWIFFWSFLLISLYRKNK